MLRRIILALIGLLAVVNGSKWLFDGKRLPTLGLADWRTSNTYTHTRARTRAEIELHLRSIGFSVSKRPGVNRFIEL